MSSVRDRRRAELRAITRLGLDELAGTAEGVHGVHRAISDRVFRYVRFGAGAGVTPVKMIHDGITDGVYATISTVTRTAGRAASAGADLPLRRPPSETASGALLIGALQGLIGDALEATGSPLAADPVTVRVDGAVVHLDDGAVPADRLDPHEVFGGSGGRIVVLLHGLSETEYAWGTGGKDAHDYGVRLAIDLGMTPVHLRYNTGRHISENGRDVARVLDRLIGRWPAPVTEIVVIGHSMGGLVARSAVHLAAMQAMAWPAAVSCTVSLGTPHLGAPLEQLAHYGRAALAILPETRPLGRMLGRRSSGIRDLRGGSLVDEDWRDRDADALGAAVAAEVPLLPTADHYFVTATLTRDARHPLGRILGDGLVLPASAAGRGRARRVGFTDDRGMHLGRANHFTLLRSDAVYQRVRQWIDQPRARAAVTGA
ncbi:hypothetical protein GCM10027289_08680 [Tsukamurella serpentis]